MTIIPNYVCVQIFLKLFWHNVHIAMYNKDTKFRCFVDLLLLQKLISWNLITVYSSMHWQLRLQGRYSLFKIGVIIALANKSINTCSFSLLSVSVMISNLNDYWKPLLNRVGSLSLLKFITFTMKWSTSLFIKKVNSQPSPATFGY